jgi:FkbH-like protein
MVSIKLAKDLEKRLKGVFQNTFENVKDLSNLYFGEDPWDSLKHVTLILNLESEFKVTLDLKDTLQIKCLTDAAEVLNRFNVDEITEISQLDLKAINSKQLNISLLSSFDSTPLANSLAKLSNSFAHPFDIKTLQFNTLQQYVRDLKSENSEREVVLLMPWDFIPEVDWRLGIPRTLPTEQSLLDNIHSFFLLLKKREGALYFYLPAPILPVYCAHNFTSKLSDLLMQTAIKLNAKILDPELFSISSYLNAGFPFHGDALSKISCFINEVLCTNIAKKTYKLLVTDLDNVMWQGVIAEDGIENIKFDASGIGWPSYIYQSLLRRFRNEGVMLAIVSRNREEDIWQPLKSGRMQLIEQDFVMINASYYAKSSQIKLISESLSIGLDDIVFVDDNPIEIEEVSITHPTVKVLQFPTKMSDFCNFISNLSGHFERDTITYEDTKRTELYQQRDAFKKASSEKGADLTDFLRGLKMRLLIKEASKSNRDRAIQLINKTNQFNLNGIRREVSEVDTIINCGGSLFIAELLDKFGSHGEILVFLIDSAGVVQSFVMSCRVFQRRIEYAFLGELLKLQVNIKKFNYVKTDKNIRFKKVARYKIFESHLYINLG